MCLALKRNSRVEKATKPITVYKELRFVGVARSPYVGKAYYTGDLLWVKNFTETQSNTRFVEKFPPFLLHGVREGLHTHTKKKRVFSRDRILVECTIPKGTFFIRGRYNEIVSLALKVGKAVSGNKDFQVKFNTKQRPKRKKKK